MKIFSKYYIYFNTSPPLPASWVTVRLESAAMPMYLDIFNALYDQLQHERIMSHLANCYHDYALNKLNHTFIVKDSFYELCNLKPSLYVKCDDFLQFTNLNTISNVKCNPSLGFTWKDPDVNIYLPIINMINFCLHNIYIAVPAIIITLQPIFISVSTVLNVLLEKLLNLSKNCWYIIVDNIIRYNHNKIKYAVLSFVLDNLKKDFEKRYKINQEKLIAYLKEKAFSVDFPLYYEPEEYEELKCQYWDWIQDENECKEILNTIRILEKIILENYNSEHIVYAPHPYDPDIGYYIDLDDEDEFYLVYKKK